MPKLIGKRFQSQYPLKISLDRVQFIFEQLPDSAAAGASGCAYATIKVFPLSNGNLMYVGGQASRPMLLAE